MSFSRSRWNWRAGGVALYTQISDSIQISWGSIEQTEFCEPLSPPLSLLLSWHQQIFSIEQEEMVLGRAWQHFYIFLLFTTNPLDIPLSLSLFSVWWRQTIVRNVNTPSSFINFDTNPPNYNTLTPGNRGQTCLLFILLYIGLSNYKTKYAAAWW